jgi:hypothetical protein
MARDDSPSVELRNTRLEKAVEDACAHRDARPLLEVVQASLGGFYPDRSPGIVHAIGGSLAAKGARADHVLRQLASSEGEPWLRHFAAAAYAARAAAGFDAKGADAALQELAEDSSIHPTLLAVIRERLANKGETALDELASWTDGYLQAYLVIEALADRDVLSRLSDTAADAVIARLDETFRLADKSSRASDRSQGVRTLRRQMPRQVAVLAARFSPVLAWVETKLAMKRPETREVVAAIIESLRKADLSKAATHELRTALEATAKPPRDPSRIIKGMRGRGKKRK